MGAAAGRCGVDGMPVRTVDTLSMSDGGAAAIPMDTSLARRLSQCARSHWTHASVCQLKPRVSSASPTK